MRLKDFNKHIFTAQESKTNLDKSEAFKLLSEDVTANGIGDIEAASEVISAIINAPGDNVTTEVLDNVIDGVSNLIDADISTNYTERRGAIVTRSVFVI